METRLASVGCLTSLRVVAVCGVVPWAEAFAVMHDDSRQIVGVASSVDRGPWAGAAVRFDVQNLVKSHMDADFLPVVPTRPPGRQISVNSVRMNHKCGSCRTQVSYSGEFYFLKSDFCTIYFS